MPLDPNDPELLRVIEISNAELERFTGATQRRLLTVYERERDALIGRLGRMGGADTFGARHAQVILSALDDAIERLEAELGLTLSESLGEAAMMTREAAVREVSVLEGRFGSTASARGIASLSGVVPHRAIARVQDLTRLEAGTLAVGIDREVRTVIQRGLVQGRNSREMVRDLRVAMGGAFDKRNWELERTLRTGFNAATSLARVDSYKEIRREFLPDLKRMGHEFIMTDRVARKKSRQAGRERVNHPFSAYLDGAVTELDEPWRIASPEFPVMFWAREDGEYVGMHYPAHLWERGREVPWRAGWESSRSQGAARAARAAEARERTERRLAEKGR